MINRELIIEKLAEKFTDDADIDTLMEFFYDAQVIYLEELHDDELIELMEENEIEE